MMHKNLMKTVLLTLALAASAVPAQADSFFGPFMGFGRHDRFQFPVVCLTDYQVRQRIAAAGFTNIYLNAPINRHIQVRATQGKWVYLIDYNRCRGEIAGIQRLRPAR